MKQPKSKLPWSLVLDNKSGFYDKEHNCFLVTDDYVGDEDLKYIVQACNNFPKAVELLNRLKTAYSTNCKESNDDGSINGWGLLVEVEEFLKEIDNGS
jgi:hypothetical protein